jgi:hypothetical protein
MRKLKINKLLRIFFVLFAVISFSASQGQQIFHKGYRFSSSSGMDVEVVNDGFLALGGYFLVKTDFFGNPIWHHWYRNSLYTNSLFKNVKLYFEANGDTSIIISGIATYPGVSDRFFVLKLDMQGNILWDYYYHDLMSNTGFNPEGLLINNNHIYICGSRLIAPNDKAMFLACIDGQGNLTFIKEYTRPDYSEGFAVFLSNDGNLFLTGITSQNSTNTECGFLLKVDLDGIPIFGKIYGGYSIDYLSSGLQLSDGNMLMAGSTYSFDPGIVMPFLIKTDSIGNLKWCKVYDKSLYMKSINLFNFNKSIIMTTHAFPNIIIADTAGTITKSFYTGSMISYGMPYSNPTQDGGFVSVASIDIASQKYLYLFKSDSLASVGCNWSPYSLNELTWQPIVESINVAVDIIQMERDSGFVYNNYPFQTYILCSTATDVNEDFIFNNLVVYPQPANELVIFKSDLLLYSNYEVQVLDVTGKILKSEIIKAESGEIKLHVDFLQPGFYLARIISKESKFLVTVKLFKI